MAVKVRARVRGTMQQDMNCSPDRHGLIRGLCRATLMLTDGQGLTEASVSRAHRGRLAELLYASGAAAYVLEDLQTTLGEGPTILAAREGRPAFIADLQSDPIARLWLAFPGEASALSIRSIYAFPLQIGVVRLGVLTLHGHEPTILSTEVMSAVLRVRDCLSLALLDPDDPGLASTFGDAPVSRGQAIINQGAGMVMAQLDATLEDAFLTLRAYALSRDMSLTEVCRQVVNRTLRFPADRPPPPEDDHGTEPPRRIG